MTLPLHTLFLQAFHGFFLSFSAAGNDVCESFLPSLLNFYMDIIVMPRRKQVINLTWVSKGATRVED